MTDTTVGTKTVEFDGTIENFAGMPLETAVVFDGSYEHILAFESIPTNEVPDNDDILKLVNDKRKANARQAAMNAALKEAGLEKPTLKDSVALQVSTIVKSLVASGKYDRAGAEKQAKTMLGLA